jgi:hypothetical protein
MWRGLVLVLAPTGMFASGSGNWAFCYELWGLSARDDNAGNDYPPERERLANRTPLFMCRIWDMDELTQNATWSESLGFTSTC